MRNRKPRKLKKRLKKQQYDANYRFWGEVPCFHVEKKIMTIEEIMETYPMEVGQIEALKRLFENK